MNISLPFTAKGSSTILHGHDYQTNTASGIPKHLEYADDVDFLCESEEQVESVVEIKL